VKADNLTAGSLALSARFTWRIQQASPLVKNLISIRSRSRFRGRSESSTPISGRPARGLGKESRAIGVSRSTRRCDPVWRVIAQADTGSVARHARRHAPQGLRSVQAHARWRRDHSPLSADQAPLVTLKRRVRGLSWRCERSLGWPLRVASRVAMCALACAAAWALACAAAMEWALAMAHGCADIGLTPLTCW